MCVYIKSALCRFIEYIKLTSLSRSKSHTLGISQRRNQQEKHYFFFSFTCTVEILREISPTLFFATVK